MNESNVSLPDLKYSAKLLLFGEYTIIEGGAALSTPLDKFYGQWLRNNPDVRISEYFKFLQQFSYLNQEKIRAVIGQGLSFKSKIPMGYGLGSSGAVTAACYDLFKQQETIDIAQLKAKLSEMESYFHGKSSGLDPLTIYLNKTLKVNENKIEIQQVKLDLSQVFLLDSNRTRNAKQVIDVFYQKRDSSSAFRDVLESLDQLNKNAIVNIINYNEEKLKSCFKEISQLQWNHFQEMIVDEVKELWLNGLETGGYYLKLSGAGGGGFYLGMGNLRNQRILMLGS